MLRHASLVMIFSDLLGEPGPILESLYRLRHGGHDVILFHILDEAEVAFPLPRHGRIGRPRGRHRLAVDADAFRGDYLSEFGALSRHLSPRMLPSRHRLCPFGYEHAIRPRTDRYLVNRSQRG